MTLESYKARRSTQQEEKQRFHFGICIGVRVHVYGMKEAGSMLTILVDALEKK